MRLKRGGWPFYWLVAIALVLTLTCVALIARASASASGTESDCEFGAISAIGPVDATGNGDTTPEVRCIP